MRPGQGAAACGVQRQGPGQAREFREREAETGTRGPPGRRGGQTARVPRGLHHRPRRPRPRRLPVASSVLSKASTSTQNKNTPHLPATPLLIGQSRPGLGTPGEGRSAPRRRRREPTPPPPGAALDREPPSSRSVGRPGASPPGQGEAGKWPSVRACVCGGGVAGGGGPRGGGECARARGPARRAKRGRHIAPEPSPPLRRLTSTHRPTRNPSFQLKCPQPWSSHFTGGPSWHPHRPGHPTPVLLSLTVALNPKCSRRSLLGAIFLLFLGVSGLGQCCRRRRGCCRRRRRLPRPGELHYGVQRGGLGGRCGAAASQCRAPEGRSWRR